MTKESIQKWICLSLRIYIFVTHLVAAGTGTSLTSLFTFETTVTLSSPLSSLSDVNVSSTDEKFIELIRMFLLCKVFFIASKHCLTVGLSLCSWKKKWLTGGPDALCPIFKRRTTYITCEFCRSKIVRLGERLFNAIGVGAAVILFTFLENENKNSRYIHSVIRLSEKGGTYGRNFDRDVKSVETVIGRLILIGVSKFSWFTELIDSSFLGVCFIWKLNSNSLIVKRVQRRWLYCYSLRGCSR